MFVKLVRYLRYAFFENIRDTNRRYFHGVLKKYNYISVA